ncbi:hypothetical protein sscle_15g106250 [Sclerotinia sclerotiorum 1980 UF-70]|uniref:Uncharacterized protein n=1 Tax=Sclerotinia sclerotiorum (strain ATCC 18683 / 1980 / Ss-1) TaxID=665079 RepID=A0A1D9QLP4_SCLS1|nr:hypothetical protein sscle_15g106250 [Sclerotinia sclerotiorum 1980 UF-70]
MAFAINDEIRENNVGASDEGVSVGDRDISTYAMMHKQGFDGMKDFMESHGLRIWNDEYAQTAHEIIEKMREFDEKYYHLSKSAQESDSDDVRGEIIEDELRGQNWVENTTRFNDLQDEELFNGVDYAPEGLESGGIGGSDGCSENIKEGFNTLGFGGEGGYSNNAFDEGGYIRYDHDGGDNRYDYGGNDYDGYDCDDGYDYDGNYD